jgi:hypothetical protein
MVYLTGSRGAMAPNSTRIFIEAEQPMSQSTVSESTSTASGSKSTASESQSTASGSKPTVSEAKRAANARNARLGGPRTPEGKARSRMNGLVHGLRAEAVVLLPGEDAGEFRSRLDGWAGDLAPRTDVERYHFEKAVTASWRRDRCIRNETAVLTERILDAVGPDPEVAVAKARRLGARLTADPAAVAHRLRKTPAGCRWMLRRWDDLGETLDQAGFWEISRLHLALALLGFTAQQWRDEWAVTAVVVAYLSARRGTETTAADAQFALGGRPAAMSQGEYEREVETIAELAREQAGGRAELKAIVAEARDDLRARLEWVEAVEARRRATAADRAAFDDSASGQRRQRYEAMHERTLRAALRDLRAEQARRLAEGDVTATTAGGGEGVAGGGPGPDPIAPTEPTEDPIIAPSEPTAEAECPAPSEPTDGPVAAPSEPTDGVVPIAPTEPTEASEVDGKDDEQRNSVDGEVPVPAVEGAGGAGPDGTVEGEARRIPVTVAGGGAARLPSPFRSGGDGPTSVGLGRGYERSW